MNIEAALWRKIEALGDGAILEIAEKYGFWSPKWRDDYGRPISPDLADLRGAIFDSWLTDNTQ